MSEQDKAEVTVSDADESSISEFMRGKSGLQEGGRLDTESRGISSEQNQLVDQQVVEEASEGNLYNPEYQNPAPAEGDGNWQQMYGQSENEKGEWRKEAHEATERLQNIEAEMAAMRTAQQYAQTYQQPNTQQNQFQQPQPQPQEALGKGSYSLVHKRDTLED